MFRVFFITGCALVGLASVVDTGHCEEPDVIFSKDILPILSDHCFQCHGPDESSGREGDLRLDDEADVKRERGGYHVILEGTPDESELISRITSTDSDVVMPPPNLGRPLSKSQINLLNRWIESGAPWGKHWAFEPIVRPEVDQQTHANPIDALIGKKLAGKKWQSNPRGSKETLVRRLSLDLRGFPPTPEEVAEFVADNSADAWNRLVDKFLADEAYGERMAWDWMEVARYADSNGYQGDGERTMWPWRDWVIRAFNENLPFDQFTVWQIAGDLLPNATEEQILATGFCRNHMINGEGGRIAEENRVDYVMDMTETMGTAWLGLTLNCCRCHDHKFDPILNREYYQFSAFFNQTPVDGGGGNPQTPPVLTFATPDQRASEAEYANSLSELEERISQRRAVIQDQFQEWARAQLEKADHSSWKPIFFTSLQSQLGQTIAVSPSGIIKTTGENPPNDTYELVWKIAEPTSLVSMLLEAIRDPAMTGGGFARSDSGNFVLTEIEVSSRDSAESPWQRLPIKDAVATFEQGNLKVSTAFDGNKDTGWAVYEGKPATKDQAALFRLRDAVTLPAGAELQIVLRHDSQHAQHNLGSFRISLTNDTAASLPGDLNSISALLAIDESLRTPEQKEKIQNAFEGSDAELSGLLESRRVTSSKLASLRAGYAKVMVMGERESPRPTFVLDRGLYNQPREEVLANTPSFLPPLNEDGSRNRLALARWIVAPENPLTARVAVNRFWQTLFGQGLVKTSEDFGIQAEYPPQQELLDWLAAEFRESGWNIKHLLRLILTSEMYCQTSDIVDQGILEADPENRFLTRAPRFRMPSWMIRDSALAASGLMNPKIGGPAVFPYQPEGVWAEATFGNKKYRQDSGDALYRRSLYTFWRRIVGPTIFFDAAKRQVCEVKPLRTNTPLHALTTLNDVTYVEAARALAALAITTVPEATAGSTPSKEDVPNGSNATPAFNSERLAFAYRRVLSRSPSESELSIWRRSYENARDTFTQSPSDAAAFLQIGQFQASQEIAPVELAAWTAICLNLLNLDESMTRE